MSPYEAGLGFAVKLNKGPFLRQALLREKKAKAALKAQAAASATTAPQRLEQQGGEEQDSGRGSRRVVATLVLQRKPKDPTAPDTVLPYGQEPVFRNGVLVGYVSSAGFGHSIGCAVLLTTIGPPTTPTTIGQPVVDKAWVEAGEYEVEIDGARHKASAMLRPAFDPKGERLKA